MLTSNSRQILTLTREYLTEKVSGARKQRTCFNMAHINDLPVEILRIILSELYNTSPLLRNPMFYVASLVSRRWTEVALEIAYSRSLRDLRQLCPNLPPLPPFPMTVRLRMLWGTENSRRWSVAAVERHRVRLASAQGEL